MSDAAVKAKTGKTWPEWFSALDEAGCKRLSHKEIVAIVSGELGIGPWWQQMVTVVYEQDRGLRKVHETAEGYQVSRSATLGVSAAKLFKAWKDAKTRSRWLADPDIVIRKAAAGKSLRITWTDGKTHVDVQFYPKRRDRCQVTVQHRKLSDAKAAARMKRYWGEQLSRLKAMLEPARR